MIKFSKEIKKIVKTAKNIAVFTHIRPDCDALGSSLALKEGLISLGKHVVCFAKDKLTQNQSLVFDYPKFSNENCDFSKFDLCFSLDAPTYERLGDYAEGFRNHPNTIVFDHHRGNNLKANYIYAFPNYSSNCEIIMEFLDFLKVKITPNIASMLYSGLSADTNSFINSNTTYQTFVNAARLVKLGADINKINELQYKNRTKVEVLCKQYLWKNIQFVNDVAFCEIDNKSLIQLDATKADCDNFSNELLGIEGINYSFSLIEEEPNNINLSMRSKEGYDVGKIAFKLGGGGHICAAGAVLKNKTIIQAREIVLDLIKQDTLSKSL